MCQQQPFPIALGDNWHRNEVDYCFPRIYCDLLFLLTHDDNASMWGLLFVFCYLMEHRQIEAYCKLPFVSATVSVL